jgi:arylsulfatase A-like enzyme
MVDTSNAAATESPRPGWGTRSIQALALALWFGLPAGLLVATFELLPWRDTRDVLAPAIADGVVRALEWAFALAILWLVLVRLLAGRLGREGAGFIATGLCLALPGLLALKLINRHFLPGRFAPVSLAANAAIALVALALVWLISHALVRWESRRPAARTFASMLVCAAASVLVYAQGNKPREEGVDVIVLLIDVLGANDLGCYGYERPTSPNIDAFAADSVLFEQAISSSSFTKTSVASLFSGRFPHHHGVYQGSLEDTENHITSDVLDSEIPTLAESFFEHGWNTAAWVMNDQLLTYMGFAQGFALYEQRAGGAPEIAGKFDAWSKKLLGRKRSFCYLHILDLHAPYNPGPGYRGRFGHTEGGVPEMEGRDWTITRVHINKGKIPFSAQDVEAYHARHDEVLIYVDEWIGRILDELKAKGRYDDSLIVLLGDHGDAFWEHGIIGHSSTPFDELIEVPLIMKLPGSAQAGRRVEQMVGLVDVAPTLLDYVGAVPPDGMDGRSFLPLLLDPESSLPTHAIFSEHFHCMAVRTEEWKYIQYPDQPPELYDLKADPAERRNVIEQYPEVAAKLALAAKAAGAQRDARGDAGKVELDPEAIKALRELGYL